MKNLAILIILLFTVTISWGQSPFAFNYQGAARDAQEQVLANTEIGLRMSIINGGPEGVMVYTEEHKVRTSGSGIFSLIIGDGMSQSGDLSDVRWGQGSYWLQVEMDVGGGRDYVKMGMSQLISVPYAMHAESASDVDDADADPQNELQTISYNSTTNELAISKGNKITIPTGGADADADPQNEIQSLQLNGTILSIDDANSIDLGGLRDGVNDADADPQNEIQSLTLNGTTLSIDDANSVDLEGLRDGVNDADADPQNEIQSLTLNGTILSIDDANSVDLGSLRDGVNDADADPQNEIQTISFNSVTNELEISKGNKITIPTGGADADPDPQNEIQSLQLNGTVLSIDAANSIDLGGLRDGVNDADSNPTNELQNLSISGNKLSISNGNVVSLPTDSFWQKTSFDDGIYFLDGPVYTETQRVEKKLKVGNNQPTSVTIDTESIFVDVPGGSVYLDSSNLDFTSASQSALYGVDSFVVSSQYGPSSMYLRGDAGGLQVTNEINATSSTLVPSALFMFNRYDTTLLSASTAGVLTESSNAYSFLGDDLLSFDTYDQYSNSASYSRDSIFLLYDTQALIGPSSTLIKPDWMQLKSVANTMELSSYTMYYDNTINRQYISADGILNQEILSPDDIFNRFSLTGDNLSLWNRAKWQTVKLGENSSTQGGELKLYSTTGDLHTHISDNDIGNSFLTMKYKSGERIQLNAFDDSGNVTVLGTNELSNAYMGTAYIDDLAPNSGGMGVMDSSGVIKAGMESNSLEEGMVYSVGSMHIMDELYNSLSCMDRYGYVLRDKDNTQISAIGVDLFADKTGYMSTNGQNGVQNFYAGANWNEGGDANRGYAGVLDAAGNAKAAMYVNTDNEGILHADFIAAGESPKTQTQYPLSIKQEPSYGFLLKTEDESNRWEQYVTQSGSLGLYFNGSSRGFFNSTDGSYAEVSDRKLKSNIKALSSTLDKITLLKPSRYHYKNTKDVRSNIGFVAQDVQDVFPELVYINHDKDGNELLSVNYSGFSAILVKAMQEQQQVISEQQEEIDTLKKRLSQIEEMLRAMDR